MDSNRQSNSLKQKSNSLESLYPEIAAEWLQTKNGDLSPAMVTGGSNRIVYWKCLKCGYE